MKIVLDTNVLMSAIFFSGTPAEILAAWRHGRIQLLISDAILEEYLLVAQRLSRKYRGKQAEKIVRIIDLLSEHVDVSSEHINDCSDPDDNKFLECVIAGHCNTLVSGDKHLLSMDGFQNLEILRPKEFMVQYPHVFTS